MKSLSKEDIHSAHIEQNFFLLYLLADLQNTIVFQPTAQASPAHTGGRGSVKGKGGVFGGSMYATWMSPYESDFI